VGGNLHLDIFAPLLVRTYGQEWFERGALSLYFLNIVVSGEPVQAVVEAPPGPGAQTRIYARRADDHSFRVCEGTASLGDHSRSELALRNLKTCDDADLRMLKGVKPGQSLGRAEGMVRRTDQDAQIANGSNNEPMDWYRGASPWGGPIASVGSTAALMFRLLVGDGERHHHDRISPHIGDALGMFGIVNAGSGVVQCGTRRTNQKFVEGFGQRHVVPPIGLFYPARVDPSEPETKPQSAKNFCTPQGRRISRPCAPRCAHKEPWPPPPRLARGAPQNWPPAQRQFHNRQARSRPHRHR
jgi:hypothetical protein